MYLYINKKERYIFSGTLWVIPINFYVSKQNLNWSSGNIYLLAYKSLQEKPTLGWKCRWSTTVYRLSGLPSRPDYLTRMWKFKTINTWYNSVLCSMPTGKVISNEFSTSVCIPCSSCSKDQVVMKNCSCQADIECGKRCYSKDRYIM